MSPHDLTNFSIIVLSLFFIVEEIGLFFLASKKLSGGKLLP